MDVRTSLFLDFLKCLFNDQFSEVVAAIFCTAAMVVKVISFFLHEEVWIRNMLIYLSNVQIFSSCPR